MVYKTLCSKENKLKTLAFISLIIVLIFLCFTNLMKLLMRKQVQRNLVYVEIINYSIPIVKHISFDSEDVVESEVSIKKTLTELLSFNMNNPLKILNMGNSYFSYDDIEEVTEPQNIISFNPFELQETSIFKKENENKASENKEDKNIQSKAYDPKLKKSLNQTKPEVFIYHTHTTESYGGGKADSFDEGQNVCAVGDELAKELEKNYGISVIHDKTVHSTMYTQSYTRSGETLNKYLNKYGDFKLIIDLHRDSVSDKKAVTTTINGENVAKIMFVMAKKNPHFNNNNKIVEHMMETSKNLFPGFTRTPMYYNTGTRFFNQDKSNNAILIEVGANTNTIDEAKTSSKYIARLIAEYLKDR